MTKHDLARTLLAQEPGRGYRHAIAADTPFVAQINGQGNALSYQKKGGAA